MDDEGGEYMPQSEQERGSVLKSPDAFRTISEVSVDLDVPQHVLRFWEGKFTQIRPLKRGGGRRYYRPEDVDLIRGIQHLLYGDGYTIKGVQKLLRENGVKFVVSAGRRGEPEAAPKARPVRSVSEAPVRIEPTFDAPVGAPLGAARRDPVFEFVARPAPGAPDESEIEPDEIAAEAAPEAKIEADLPVMADDDVVETVDDIARGEAEEAVEVEEDLPAVSPERQAAAAALLDTLRTLKASYDAQLQAIKQRA